MGLETEFGYQILPPEPGSAFCARLVDPLRGGRTHAGTNFYLSNGGRLYIDTGSHPEYATPETTNARDLVTWSRAGDLMLRQLATRVETDCSPGRPPPKIFIVKNNVALSDARVRYQPFASVSIHGLTDFVAFGSHENYLIRRRLDYQRLCDSTVPFLATRQIFVGTGRIYNGKFQISQRAEFMTRATANASTRDRGMILNRDESHGRATDRRFQIICGDSNVLELPEFLRLGTMDLVISGVEDGLCFDDLELEAVEAMKSVSRDSSLRQKLHLHDGRRLTAIEVQQAYFERIEAAAQRWSLSDAQIDVLNTWRWVLERLADDPDDLLGAVDWITKQMMITADMRKRGYALDSWEAAQRDVEYHALGSGFHQVAMKLGGHFRVTSDEAIEAAIATPPTDTRAVLRSAWIRASHGRREMSCDWTILRTPEQQFHIRDPYKTTDRRLMSFLETLDKPARWFW